MNYRKGLKTSPVFPQDISSPLSFVGRRRNVDELPKRSQNLGWQVYKNPRWKLQSCGGPDAGGEC